VGDGGTGKGTIARALADELGATCQEVDVSDLKARGDLTAVLANLQNRQVLVARDWHRLAAPLQRLVMDAMQKRKFSITIGQGRSARSHTLEVTPFTLVATCSKKGECSADWLNNFALVLSLRPYLAEELRNIAEAVAIKLGVKVEAGSAAMIASNSNSPRQASILVQRLARVLGKDCITEEDTRKAFAAFGLVAVALPSATSKNVSLEISGIDFERLVATLLTRMGFRAEMTKTTGDGGIDIVAVLDKAIVGGKYLFQCKRYTPESAVGAAMVRDFYGAVTADRATKGIFITTSYFTLQAQEFGEKVGLELIDSGRLQILLAENGMEGLSR
jgi:restriction endonuclease Mrr